MMNDHNTCPDLQYFGTSDNDPVEIMDFSTSATNVKHALSPKKSVLQEQVFGGSDDLSYKIFHADTLPQISNEYPYTNIYEGMESEVDKSSDNANTELQSNISFDRNSNKSTESSKKSHTDVIVKCLQTYDDLVSTCEKQGLKFVDCSADEDLSKVIKSCSVNCLQSMEDLENECTKLCMTFVPPPPPAKLYEVDLILDDNFIEGEKHYCVKWKDWELKHNTWEPNYHLVGCQDLIIYYESLKNASRHVSKMMIEHFIRELITRKPYDYLTLMKLHSVISDTPENYIMKSGYTTTQLRQKAKDFLDFPVVKINKIKSQLWDIMKFSEARKRVLINLKEWEIEINSFNPATYIQVENNVDLEEAPTGFQFIHDYISSGIETCGDPVAFCCCDNCYENKQSCCPRDSDGHFSYNKFRRLQLLPGYPVYECNKNCKCGKDCINRVVQHGQKIKVAIFRTSNGCGWGLKALETIQKDQFVLEYLGEILTSEDAEQRGSFYDYVGRSYLFDLDYGEENCQYTVDAGHVGNAAHFINHSCEPNLHVFAVWIDQQNPLLPRLAFFAKKKINRGTELTFDYKMVKNHERFGPETPIPDAERMPCKCNSRNCRKYLF